jgi:hypothetical protein
MKKRSRFVEGEKSSKRRKRLSREMSLGFSISGAFSTCSGSAEPAGALQERLAFDVRIEHAGFHLAMSSDLHK